MEILYSDQDIIVINKPPGLPVHSGGSVFGRTLVDELLERFPEIAGVGDEGTWGQGTTGESVLLSTSHNVGSRTARPGIVHRLDRETSGVMVVARRQESFAALKEIFQKRLAEKTYLAIVCGTPKEKEGTINLQIGRFSRDPTKRGVVAGRNIIRGARDATTGYRVVKTGAGMALVELKPKTGRMHQLRVHMKAIGHPVACDVKYGGKDVCCPIGADAASRRHLLHAQSLSFSYPEGRRNSFEADPPPDFALALKALF
ncbi:MAG: hypothetical protein A3B34_03390 [Candidatus Sungbacteria bacterium RIFCSPLOWO2_01_FULL_54_21]|uniref:Pseudouridine synthase RsuA/RluA-like domain-containing protein n=1 Tax=Candidatus Sungbacteria bacterium RIFCSPLOWO2_01_FULL_54_21 TaxID=1802279 RepID=A0A1G2L557_9BACT|nr:MAG: hypothetical protein A3B34_03390 [Candidatus Sungbacteria bacterium RIFCSPLOWO2_01_FULL_54_21]